MSDPQLLLLVSKPRGRPRSGEVRVCDTCHEPFYAAPAAVRAGQHYCSHACYHEAQRAGGDRTCLGCGKSQEQEAFGARGRCRPCERAAQRAYRRANSEANKARAKRHRERHKERIAARGRVYYAANAEKWRDYGRESRARRPELKAKQRMVEKARKLGAPGYASPTQIQARMAYYGGLCWICGRTADTIDHVVALARGGSNWPANLRPACRSCNSRKGDRPWQEAV